MVWYAAIFATVVVSLPLMYRTARGAFESFDETLADEAAAQLKAFFREPPAAVFVRGTISFSDEMAGRDQCITL